MNKLPNEIRNKIREYVSIFWDKMGYRHVLYPIESRLYSEATENHRREFKKAKADMRDQLKNGIEEAEFNLKLEKHEKIQKKRMELFKPIKNGMTCVYCKSIGCIKNGIYKKSGKQRWICKSCGKRFC